MKSIPSDVLLMATENPVTVLLSTVSEKSLELKLPPFAVSTDVSSLNVIEKEVPADGTAVELLYVGAAVSIVIVVPECGVIPVIILLPLTLSVRVTSNEGEPLSPLAIT